MAKKEWKDKSREERKWYLIRLIGGIAFLIVGAVFALVSLFLNGWNFREFITNPTVVLVVLVALALGVTFVSMAEVK